MHHGELILRQPRKDELYWICTFVVSLIPWGLSRAYLTQETVTAGVLATLAVLVAVRVTLLKNWNVRRVAWTMDDRALELDGVELLCRDGTDGQGRPYGIGRVGTAPQAGCSAAEFAAFIKEKLSACSVRFVETGRPVRRVAVGGGACASMLSDALAAGCDTFVTADVKYDQYLEAKALGINLMDAGHFATEDVVCPALVQFLSRHFPKVEVRRTETHREAYDSV